MNNYFPKNRISLCDWVLGRYSVSLRTCAGLQGRGGARGGHFPQKILPGPPKFFRSLSESPTQIIDSSPYCKTGPSSGPPNENVWLRPCCRAQCIRTSLGLSWTLILTMQFSCPTMDAVLYSLPSVTGKRKIVKVPVILRSYPVAILAFKKWGGQTGANQNCGGGNTKTFDYTSVCCFYGAFVVLYKLQQCLFPSISRRDENLSQYAYDC